MKLELKHLAPYLPCNLEIARLTYEDEYKNKEYNLSTENINEILQYRNLKPILSPLSDLTKEDLIEELGTTISHLDWVTEEREYWIRFYSHNHWLNNIPYEIYSYLIENHFDVFGLIPQGLAIDINTL